MQTDLLKTHAKMHAFIFMCIHTFTSLKPAIKYRPKANRGHQGVLLGTLFCSKSRMALKRHRGALLMSLYRSFSPSLAAHIALVLCKPSYCCHKPPLHPHFHLYPIFHFISMLILEGGGQKNPMLCHL